MPQSTTDPAEPARAGTMTIPQKLRATCLRMTVLWKQIPYQGITGTILTDSGIFGVSSCADEKEMLKRLGAFL